MTEVRIGVGIAHTDRDAKRRMWIREIEDRLCFPAAVVKDLERNLWRTNKAAIWAFANPKNRGTTHHLWLQDDMMPCPNFRSLLCGAVEARPDAVISLFTMRATAVAEAANRGVAWIETPDAAWGGTVVAPVDLWRDFLAWEHQNVRPDFKSADRRVSLWALARGIPIYVTVPSLLEHVGAADSLIGHSMTNRTAAFLSDGSPVDWNTDAVKVSGTMPVAKVREVALR